MPTIRITGEINDETFSLFSEQLEQLEESGELVNVELCSPGGDAHVALAISARMRRSLASITVIAYGYVASAAVLILASGKIRLMTQEAWVMVHEESGTLEFDSTTGAKREVDQFIRLEGQWNALLEQYTGTPAIEWAIMHKETTHLSVESCLRLGLVDKIV